MKTNVHNNLNIESLHIQTLNNKKQAQTFINQDFKGLKIPLATYTHFRGQKGFINRVLLHKMRFAASGIMTDAEKNKWAGTEKLNKKYQPRMSACGVSMGILKGNTGVDEKFLNATVDIVKGKDKKVHFHKLASCALIWRCPVCSLKILKGREDTIYALAKSHERKEKAMGFLTFTLPHAANETLETNFNKLIQKYNDLQHQRFFKEFRSGCTRKGLENVGYILGQIKSVEITWKALNGWHPHLHILNFYDLGLNEQDKKCINHFQKKCLAWWVSHTGAKMIGQDSQICYGIKGAADYMAKWDAVKEITSESLKSSKGISPFGILKKLALNDFRNVQEKIKLRELYREYCEVTKGRHRISFGRNLRKAYPEVVQDETDQELCEKIEIREVIMQFHLSAWKQITQKHLQPYLINFYLSGGMSAVVGLLSLKNINFKIEKYSDSLDFETGEFLQIPQIK